MGTRDYKILILNIVALLSPNHLTLRKHNIDILGITNYFIERKGNKSLNSLIHIGITIKGWPILALETISKPKMP